MGNLQEILARYTHIKCFLKGPPGDGKTFAAAMISHLCPTLFIDVEGGIVSARDVVNRENLTVRLIKQANPKTFFEELGVVAAEAASGNYGAVVVDSISEIVGRMEDEYACASADGKVGAQDWYRLTERVKKFARFLRDLNCHTIVTSITKPTGRDEDAKSIFEPVLPGQTSAVVQSFFDIVALMRKKPAAGRRGTDYFLVTDGPSVFQVRDRTRTLDAEELIDASKPGTVWKKALAGIMKISGKEA